MSKSTVLNHFEQPLNGKDNIFNLNGTWKINDEKVTASASYLNGMLSIVETSIDYITTTLDHIILCDATNNLVNIALYSAINNRGRTINIKKIDSSVNSVVIDGNGSQRTDGNLTFSLLVEDETVTLVSNGSNWFII